MSEDASPATGSEERTSILDRVTPQERAQFEETLKSMDVLLSRQPSLVTWMHVPVNDDNAVEIRVARRPSVEDIDAVIEHLRLARRRAIEIEREATP